MLKFLRKLHIRSQFMLLALSTGIVMFTIIFLIYAQVSKIVAAYNSEYTDNMMFQIERTISSNCKQVDRLLTSIAFDRIVQNYISETDPEKKYLIFKDLNNLIINLSSMNDTILDIAILDKNDERVYFLHGENEQVKDIIGNIPENDGNYYTGVQEIKYTEQLKKCFVVSCDIESILADSTSSQKMGKVAIVLDAEMLSLNVNQELNRSSTRFYLLDRADKVYSVSQPSQTEKAGDAYMQYAKVAPGKYSMNLEGKEYAINKANLPELDGKIISVIPEEELFFDIALTRKLSIALFLLALAILAVPFMVITNNIVSPLKKFISFFSLVKEKKLVGLQQRLKAEGYVEMAVMVREFNNLLDEIENLTQKLVYTNSRLYESELEKKKSELAYLKSQINPHFLYNTLEVMKGCAIDEGAVNTLGMAKALAQVFRYSVKGADLVTLSEEVEIIKSYLFIQQIRFSGRFTIFYDFSEESLQCAIPKMILQPIAENAIFHGLETKLGEGRLWFEGRVDERQELTIRIRDDGVGIGSETLGRIAARLKDSHETDRFDASNENIGIKNVDNRIKLTYGDQYGVQISSVSGQGTEVTIRLPAGRK
jgi:two-component system, sensor histidine kinase YesM